MKPHIPIALQVAQKIAQPTAEEWWEKTARLLAEKMKQSGVADFRVSLTESGTYKFEVTPVGLVPNVKVRDAASDSLPPDTSRE